ncbi:collagen EMF1-alpha-like [Hippopotamus amphibius kiboko]|uniref:collagen EMF1-alpha-like n=1 Tax=Hippopotamus amphibius kiboko TaxID=575201 RepID=UPI00259A57A8|nr:collagen EMF1-alpha-like [Hippopotamus amphibius kiboko]
MEAAFHKFKNRADEKEKAKGSAQRGLGCAPPPPAPGQRPAAGRPRTPRQAGRAHGKGLFAAPGKRARRKTEAGVELGRERLPQRDAEGDPAHSRAPREAGARGVPGPPAGQASPLTPEPPREAASAAPREAAPRPGRPRGGSSGLRAAGPRPAAAGRHPAEAGPGAGWRGSSWAAVAASPCPCAGVCAPRGAAGGPGRPVWRASESGRKGWSSPRPPPPPAPPGRHVGRGSGRARQGGGPAGWSGARPEAGGGGGWAAGAGSGAESALSCPRGRGQHPPPRGTGPRCRGTEAQRQVVRVGADTHIIKENKAFSVCPQRLQLTTTGPSLSLASCLAPASDHLFWELTHRSDCAWETTPVSPIGVLCWMAGGCEETGPSAVHTCCPGGGDSLTLQASSLPDFLYLQQAKQRFFPFSFLFSNISKTHKGCAHCHLGSGHPWALITGQDLLQSHEDQGQKALGTPNPDPHNSTPGRDRGRLEDPSPASTHQSMWDLPGAGIEPVTSALVGGFLTTAPPRKPLKLYFLNFDIILFYDYGKLTWFQSQVYKTKYIQRSCSSPCSH